MPFLWYNIVTVKGTPRKKKDKRKMKARYDFSMMVGTKGCGTIIKETLLDATVDEAIAKFNELQAEWEGQIISISVFEDGCKIA